jgi:hypothetical protein
MSTTFQQVATSLVGGFPEYLWSDAANWTAGVPVDGAAVSFNILGGGNPSGYDDIAGLFLDSLNLANGFVAVGGTLSVGTVSFGSTAASLYSDTVLGSAAATLTIGAMSGEGRIGAFGANAVTYVLAATDPGEIYQVDEGGELVLNATPSASPPPSAGFYYQNSGPPSGTFAFHHPGATIGDLLAGVATGDSIALPGSYVASVTYGASSLTVVTDLGTTTFSDVTYQGSVDFRPKGFIAALDPLTGLEKITFIACYLRGTLIFTPNGEVPVEQLKIGDQVVTLQGKARPIEWIGRRSYSGRFVLGRDDILPVCVKAGALDDGIPRRDLWVSPNHALYLEGVLIEAKDLVNGASIYQSQEVTTIEYFHIELDAHDVVLAEGAWAESYLDDDNRGLFHNAHEYWALHPESDARPAQYCVPRREEGFAVDRARTRIAERAGIEAPVEIAEIGTLRGHIDQIGRRITGWAQDETCPEAPVCLDIYAGNELIGQAVANRYRPDLGAAGIGNGELGFEFVPPPGLAFAPGSIRVCRSRDGTALTPSSTLAQHLRGGTLRAGGAR